MWTAKRKIYMSILVLIFRNNLRLSFSICLMSLLINTFRSKAPSLVTSTTRFPFSPSPSLSLTNKDDLNRSKVGNLSIAAHCKAYSISGSSFTELNAELLWKLELWCRNDDLRLLPISASSILSDSISSVPIFWAIFCTWGNFKLNWKGDVYIVQIQSKKINEGNA